MGGRQTEWRILRVLVKTFDRLIILSCFPMVRPGFGNTLFEVRDGSLQYIHVHGPHQEETSWARTVRGGCG